MNVIAADTAGRVLRVRHLPLLLGYLQAVGPMSTDMYLPGLPAIDASFGVAAGSAEITLATWVLGLAFGQIGGGLLADRYGRRAPLIAGTLLYTLAAALCALAPSLTLLSAARFLSALGASASMIVPRAVVRDVASGAAAARLLSRLILVLGAAPILAPSLGGLMLPVFGWRGIFWVMTAYGAIGTALAWRFLPDTLPRARRIPVGGLRTVTRRFAGIAREPQFAWSTLTLGAVAFALFAYLGGSPDAFIRGFGLSPGRYAVAFSTVAAAYIGLSQLGPTLVSRFGLDRCLAGACSVHVAGACVTAGVLWFVPGGRAFLPFTACLALTQGVTGVINPAATAVALGRHEREAGAASALLGTVQFTAGALGGALAGVFGDGTARPMAALILAGAVVAKTAERLRPRAARR